jgi:hypothetical protein
MPSMMNNQVKQLWVEALRSGEYKQSTGFLHNHADGSYCALGVLCEIARQEGIINRQDDLSDDNYSFYGVWGDMSSQVLPKKVQEWAGIDMDCPEVAYTHDLDDSWVWEPVVDLNDRGWNFKMLAALIEESL